MNNMIPAVDKTILLLLALSERPSTQAELSGRLGIAMSTTYRILMTLQAHRWIRKKTNGVYELSDGLLALNRGISDDVMLLERLSRKVAEISEKHQVACKLSVRREKQQLTYYRAEPSGPVALTGQPGSTFPLIEGSVGAALLADESTESLQAHVQSCEDDIPEKKQPELLFEAVKEVRERGTVLNIRKNRWNIAACSIPVRNAGGEVFAALTLIGSADDFAGKKRDRWEQILKKAVAECTSSQ